MGVKREDLHHAIKNICLQDRDVNQAVDLVGLPEPRISEPGFAALMRILVGQQLSVKAAASIWTKFETLVGSVTPDHVLSHNMEQLRSAGLSKQKAVYAHALSQAVHDGALDFSSLAKMEEDEAKAKICAVKGLGPWSAEIYLLFCEGRIDIWPAGDLALQVALKRLKGLDERPSAKSTLPLVEPWRPNRSAMAVFLWHYYAMTTAKSEAPI